MMCNEVTEKKLNNQSDVAIESSEKPEDKTKTEETDLQEPTTVGKGETEIDKTEHKENIETQGNPEEKDESKNERTEIQGTENAKKISNQAMQKFDNTQFNTLSITCHTCSVGKAGAVSIVNSDKNGKRFTIAKDPMNKIGNPEAVKIALSKNKIAISAAPLNSPNSLKLGRIGAKGVIYSTELVKTLTERYSLNFSDRVSITFDRLEYKLDGNKVVAEITMM